MIHHDHNTDQGCNTQIRVKTDDIKINIFNHSSAFDNYYLLLGLPKNLGQYSGGDYAEKFSLIDKTMEINHLIYGMNFALGFLAVIHEQSR